MSLLRSWFQQKAAETRPSWLPPQDSPRNGLLSAAAERVPSPSSPRSTSHSPIPPDRSRSTSQRSSDPLLALERYETDIQRHLQSLLDAQGEGLLAGFGSQDTDAQSMSDAASSTAAKSTGLGKTIPVRQPAPKPLSLRAARRGIKSAMRELLAIKEREADIYEEELVGNQETVSRITAWEVRREGLNKEMLGIQNSEGSSRAEELHKESGVLQEQITAIENQLMELKGQHNAVKLELSRVENSVQSKLSSYTASMKMLDEEVKEFLARPPQHPQRTSPEETSYFTLPPPRRTLDMALEHIQEEKKALEERQQTTREERDAIEEGLVAWDDTVKAISKFEYTLKRNIQALEPKTPAHVSTRTEAASTMSELVEQMDQVMTDLDSKIKLADTRGWKLLVCCIGAELEALRQGRGILEQAQSTSDHKQPVQSEESEALVQIPPRSESPGESPVRRSTDSFRRRNDRPAARTYRPEDDEPDPELLITRTDTDTE